MGFRKDGFATVWSVEQGKGKSMKVRISSSHKNKDTGEYEQDFSGFCIFIGNACVKAAGLKPKDRIRLGDVDVTTWYNKETKQERVTYKVFDFELIKNAEEASVTLDSVDDAEEAEEDADSDENTPF